jgi:hypothetical protein
MTYKFKNVNVFDNSGRKMLYNTLLTDHDIHNELLYGRQVILFGFDNQPLSNYIGDDFYTDKEGRAHLQSG